jgi:hypothetical protein
VKIPEGVCPEARAWLGWWELMRRWHRFTLEGDEALPRDRAVLLVGYHGRPIAHDLCMMQNVLAERLGYLPHPIVHAAFEGDARSRRVMSDLGFVSGDGPALAALLARREHVIVTPGGTAEGCRSHRHRYEVNWGRRTGYIRLALRYGLDIFPVASDGADDAFIGLNDGYRLGKRLGVKEGVPVWFGLGLTGLWPLALPLPVRVRCRIGAPIRLADLPVSDPADREGLQRAHALVVGRVQSLLDSLRRGR